MLKHIVLFKLKSFAEGASKEDNAKKIKRELEALVGKIPEIKKMEVGLNSTPSNEAYDIAIYSEFANEADLAAYTTHPEHKKIVDFVTKVRESRVVVDYIM